MSYIIIYSNTPSVACQSNKICIQVWQHFAKQKNKKRTRTQCIAYSIVPKAVSNYQRNELKIADRMKKTNDEPKNKTNDPNLTLCRRILFVRLFSPLRNSVRISIRRANERGKTTKGKQCLFITAARRHRSRRLNRQLNCRLHFILYYLFFVLLCTTMIWIFGCVYSSRKIMMIS